MTYTPDNQLQTWSRGTASQSWTLDSRGNWTNWTSNGTAQIRTHTGGNELTKIVTGAGVSAVTNSVTWDLAGNLTSDGSLTYAWNARGLMASASNAGGVVGSYGYDPLGRRTVKTAGGIKTISVYDGWQCVWQKVTGSGTDTAKSYTYGDYIDRPIAMIRKWGLNSDTVWHLQGNNESVEALTDRTGAIVERYEYSPYGKATVYTGKGVDGAWFTADDVTASVSARGNGLTFQGRELDGETNLLYFRNRYYSPAMGRFVSRDLYRFKYGMNLFLVDANNPIGYVDPLGNSASANAPVTTVSAQSLYNQGGLGETKSIFVSGKYSVKKDCPDCAAVEIDAGATLSLNMMLPRVGDKVSVYMGLNVVKVTQRDLDQITKHENKHVDIFNAAFSFVKAGEAAMLGCKACGPDAESKMQYYVSVMTSILLSQYSQISNQANDRLDLVEGFRAPLFGDSFSYRGNFRLTQNDLQTDQQHPSCPK